MSLKSNPRGSLGAGVAQRLPKAPQGGLQVPLEVKMTPKLLQNGTKNGATTLIETPAVPLSSSEIREKLAYIPGSPEEREAGINPEQRRGERKSWHTTRASPGREMQQPPKLSHAPACRGGMGEANLCAAAGLSPACKACQIKVEPCFNAWRNAMQNVTP